MSVWVSKAKIEGIRGFNGEMALELGPGLNLLLGKNGAGKTSFLQAIEWCLTGKMKYMEGDEFSREDAIVNLFNTSGVGKVTLLLHSPKGELEVTRKRKRGKSTTRGSSPLSVRQGNRTLEDEDAESLLEKTLGLPIDEISNSVYLHQEALRAILSDDPKERSRSIDKMLGMEEVRSLAEALSSKRNITAALKQLQVRIETLKRDKVQFAIMTRENVEKKKKSLIERGHSEDDFDLVSQVKRASAIAEGSSSLKGKFSSSATIPGHPRADVLSVGGFIEAMDEAIRSIDRDRSAALQSVYKEKIQLENLKDQITKAREELQRLSEASEDDLEAVRNRLAEEAGTLAKRIDGQTRSSSALSSVVSALIRAHDRVSAIRSSRNILESSISNIERAAGDEDAHSQLIAKFKDESAAIERSLDSLGSLEKLLDSALDYVTDSKPQKCPVCEQTIFAENVIGLIKKNISENVSKNISLMKTRRKSLASEIHELESSLKELKELKGRLTEERDRERKALKDAETEIGMKLEDDLALQTESKKEELHKAEAEIRQLKEELNKTNSRLGEVKTELDRLINARDGLAAAVKRAQTQLNSHSDEARLIEEIDERIAKTSRIEGEFQDTKELDDLKNHLDALEEINDFSKSEVELDRIEREVPSATALINELERRVSSLKDLDASIAALKEVVTEYERKAVGNVIESLENSFNRYFQSLDPHDHFKRVRVEIEEGQPPVYSIRALGEDQSTYITTRFSGAQMNAAAIALFLAKHEKVSGDLKTILLDDPTQSMDSSHKSAVCRSITGLLKEGQVILATQDEEVKRLAQNASKEVKTFEFSHWTVEGPVIG